MNQADHTIVAEEPTAQQECGTDFNADIASLRAAGAHRFDPVRFHYIEALARRSGGHEGNARRMLDVKLADALSVFKERFHLAQSEAKATLAQAALQYQDKSRDFETLHASGDFKGLRRMVASLKREEQSVSLSALVRQLGNSFEKTGENAGGESASYIELKAIRHSRNTWAKLSIERQLAQAFKQAPKNAGPINSHMLVLRTLALMQDISPDYLGRFMIYADTLLALDRDDKQKPIEPKKGRVAKTKKK